MFHLVFLLDITGSMSNELEGVKATVAQLVQTVTADIASEMLITIVTFTEDHKDCYVTSDTFTDGAKAAQFVSKVKLCCPPGIAGVNASGGDGPENHKAALAELLLMDAEMPTVAFMITDAIPHMISEPSTEASHEKRHFAAKHAITDMDLFHILDALHAKFQERLILNVVKYYPNLDHAIYGAVAKRFNGVLISPTIRTPQELANGLMAILLRLFASLTNDPNVLAQLDTSSNPLAAFSFYDLEPIQIPSDENHRWTIANPTVGSTDDLLFKLIERATVIVGARFTKRAITARVVNEQVELLLVVAKALSGAISNGEAMERAGLLLKKINELIGKEHRRQFKLTSERLFNILSNHAATVEKEMDESMDGREAAVSAITLMSIEETARDVASEGEEAVVDPAEALLRVASLFFGHLAVLQLPTRLGVVDFMDAWSASIDKVANDVVSAADFLALIGDATTVGGLSEREREYNFLQLVADPEDAWGTTLLQVASGTQLLDILTALLSGAPAGLFSPNMFRGTVSASLLRLLVLEGELNPETTLREYQSDIVRKMTHTIRSLMGNPPPLALEPASAVSKHLFRVLRLQGDSRNGEEGREQVRLFLEELAASQVQKFAKYRESNYLALVEKMVGYKHKEEVEDVFVHHVLLDSAQLSFDASHAVAVILDSQLSVHVSRAVTNVLAVVYEHDESIPALAEVWPTFHEDLVKLLLLQKRTERYTLNKTEQGDEWVRNEEVMLPLATSKLFPIRALKLMQDKHDASVRAIRARRLDLRKEEQWRKVVAMFRLPMREFIPQLNVLVKSSSRKEYKLLSKAFRLFGHELEPAEYETKLLVALTGRQIRKKTGDIRVVFNRGNLHPMPERFTPLSDAFKQRLRELQRDHAWPLTHRYRDSDAANRHGFCNTKPSPWAAKRYVGKTFWETGEDGAVAA
ncbi:hypothetical protein Poli38472_012174 [Pythium oligandrum]|uniref:VWFA domain-containing protein n=1 Tax=Pythium oligandrum TaxID=41045 RepID=A0A8K1CRL5_PYTOL|nr:hypothetical protein Poli38472_012174 [Pythium oligandrum]|eukprot:TMW67058.1 hypothetical protein Poli38472_012174 [Pythium oligandrum]